MAARQGGKWGQYSQWKGEGGCSGASEQRETREENVRSLGGSVAQPGRCQKSAGEGLEQPGQTCVCSSTGKLNSFKKRRKGGLA